MKTKATEFCHFSKFTTHREKVTTNKTGTHFIFIKNTGIAFQPEMTGLKAWLLYLATENFGSRMVSRTRSEREPRCIIGKEGETLSSLSGSISRSPRQNSRSCVKSLTWPSGLKEVDLFAQQECVASSWNLHNKIETVIRP